MKILHVVPYFSPAWAFGGPPRAVYELARQQVKQGHHVTVLTTDAYEKDQRLANFEEVIDNIAVFRVQNISNFLMWHYHFSTPRSLPAQIVDQDFDVVHLHEVRTLLNVRALLVWGQRSRLILSPWGTLPYNDQLVWFKRLFDSLFLSLFQKRVAVGLGQTEHEVKVLQQFRIGHHRELVPLGITIEEYKNLPSREQSRKQLKIDNNEFVFLFLGRYAAKKGLDLLIKAFKPITEKYPQSKLVLVGRDDGFLDQIHQQIKKLNLESKVVVSEPLYGKDRFQAYRATDVFVSTPIVYEETSTTCLEALACGTAVITSDRAQIPFLTEKDGVKEVAINTQVITEAMEQSIKSPTKVSLDHLKTYFDWKEISAIVIKYYQSHV